MTSPNQIAANRRNAMRSSGPKTQSGKQQSSLNASKHGLTTPIESTQWLIHLSPLIQLLSTEGLSESDSDSDSRELALCILDYERNLEYQRQIFAINKDRARCGEFSMHVDPNEFEHLLADPRLDELAEVYEWVRRRVEAGRAKYLKSLMRNRLAALRRDHLGVLSELRNADRHLRRSANQLIRRCRSLWSDSASKQKFTKRTQF